MKPREPDADDHGAGTGKANVKYDHCALMQRTRREGPDVGSSAWLAVYARRPARIARYQIITENSRAMSAIKCGPPR